MFVDYKLIFTFLVLYFGTLYVRIVTLIYVCVFLVFVFTNKKILKSIPKNT